MTTLNFKLPILLGREPFTLLTVNGPNPAFPVVGYGTPYDDTGKTNIYQFDLEGRPEGQTSHNWLHLKQAPLKVSGHMIFHLYSGDGADSVQTDFVEEGYDLKESIERIKKRHRDILAVVRVEIETPVGTMELPAAPVAEASNET